MSRASRTLDDEELRDLCATSTRRNMGDGITGLFLYDGARFLQAIEGDTKAVKGLMTRIANDSRHTDIAYITDGAVEQREFPHWSMEEPPTYGDDPERFVEQVKADVSRVEDAHLRAQFIGFARMAASERVKSATGK